MKPQIKTKKDIELLVNEFYKKATNDKDLGHIFNDVAKVNWNHHLPIMYAFWESVLFGEVGYSGNPMDAHFKLNEKIPLTSENFNTWKFLFCETVDEHFEGAIANSAKEKAVSIADLMFYKINNYYNAPGKAKKKK